MRVVSGIAKGKKLVTPDGLDVRPTIDRVKEAVFSSLQFELEGRIVLDLFAGSGQLGIEAISRGATKAYFVDCSDNSLNAVKTNLKNVDFLKQSVVVNNNSIEFLKGTSQKFDIALLDPPYNKGILLEALPLLVNKMSNSGVIVCEHSAEESLPESFDDFFATKVSRYGKVGVTFYRRRLYE